MDLFSSPKTAEDKALSVTQLLRRMKNLLEVQVGEVWVEGEVSNLKKQGSGHWYFSLKDAGAQIQCAMFGARKRPGADALEDGAKVRVFAEASVYEARGQLQIIVQNCTPRVCSTPIASSRSPRFRKRSASSLPPPARPCRTFSTC
jgi:exodeoxyribonuclease VII large subunit